MSAIYYVTRPGLGIDALVEAPSTEKARTTFLDYLERSGALGRSQRGRFRVNMVAEKMEEPHSAQAQLTLRYGGGYEPEPESRRLGSYSGIPEGYSTPEDVDYGDSQDECEVFQEPQYEEVPIARSPLERFVREHPII